MIRFHLPPNFAAAVVRNAVPLRVEVDLSTAPAPEVVPVLALLQRWAGTPTPPKFIQLNRAQLRELAAAAAGHPVFVENGTVTPWNHERLLATEDARPPAADSTRPPPVRKSRADPPLPPMVVDGSEHFLAVTLPSREHPGYEAALALLKEGGFTLEPSNRKWWLRDRHKTLNFLASHLATLRERFNAEFTANFEKNTARLRQADITAEVGSTGGGYSVAIGITAGRANDAELRSAIAANRGYLEADGNVFLLEPDRLRKVAAAQRALAGDPNATVTPHRSVTVPPARIPEVQEVLEQLSPGFQPPETWRGRTAALRNLTTLAPAPIPPALDRQLRPYQRLGVAWLWQLRRGELGGILADEMGLGKTLQALGLLSVVQTGSDASGATTLGGPPRPASSGDRGSGRFPAPTPSVRASLVVCPASLLENWRREAARFTPELRVFVHHGERRLSAVKDIEGCDLIITSYGTLTRDQSLFATTEFAVVIADEAQHIKNRRSQNAAALRALRAQSRFLLTGTPVENSLDDLRSLFEFLLPGYLTRVPAGLRGEERAWYDERLRAQTAPYILRRTKRTVAPELPEKIEQIVWCELTPGQAELYRETQERSERELIDLEAAGATEASLKFAALTQLLRLRQICCDPRLVRPHSTAAAPPDRPPGDSAKLDAFLELLEEAVDDGHRVLVFSQFTSLLGLLRAELDAGQVAHCYLDGAMPARARQAEVDRFQQTAEIPLFLLSLKAGGTGLNLTGADVVVHFDPWWNPAAEAQATDRAHRIGQTRTVTSYKLIASGTVEEKVLALQTEKRALLADVFEASDAAAAKLSLADLRDLLK
ncbi:MAG TPA: DEAD/DEAH box helicase [Opitutaceae bacterium]|nr:DEAD/DEAH box helicase [Opitutaceae bacterium]